MVNCLAVSGFLSPLAQTDCISLDLQANARISQDVPQSGVHRRIGIPNSRFAVGVRTGHTGIDLIAGSIRSAGDQSFIGIDGESWVFQIQKMSIHHQIAGLRLEGGMVDDLWTLTQNQAWNRRALALGAAEEMGLMTRADMGMTLSYQHPWITAAFRISSGEGFQRRERNTGFSSSALIRIQSPTEKTNVALDFFAQEGSVGMELARDHRLGARAHGSFGALNLGVESLVAYGVSGDPLQTPIMVSSWVSWESDDPFLGHLRWDGSFWDAGLVQRIHLGLGWRANDNLTLWLGSRSQIAEEAVSDFPGADALNQTHNFFFQLTSRWLNTTSTNTN